MVAVLIQARDPGAVIFDGNFVLEGGVFFNGAQTSMVPGVCWRGQVLVPIWGLGGPSFSLGSRFRFRGRIPIVVMLMTFCVAINNIFIITTIRSRAYAQYFTIGPRAYAQYMTFSQRQSRSYRSR